MVGTQRIGAGTAAYRGIARGGLRPVDPAAVRVTVLVPAHNEQDQIAETIASLLAQSRTPDRIVVVADNCTDRTVEIAARYPVRVVTTVGNTAKKAGALNQVLDGLLPDCTERDAILVMDADSTLATGFLAHAVERLATGTYAAVGGTFTGKPGGGFVGMLQRNEYARYARDVNRRKGRVLVLTGTATLFRADVLTEVVTARADGALPGSPHVYDTHVLTEDNELTLAVLHLGYRIVSPKQCTLTTEVMPTWRALFRQRLRWKRGALENLLDYGCTRVTVSYWRRQAMSLVGIVVAAAYLGSLAYALVLHGAIHLSPLWTVVTAVFALERAVSVRRRGPAMMALGATVVVEMVFDVFLQAAQTCAFVQTAVRAERRW
ncbi:glycosyltransferase [Actinocatenispora rupis]|uniref:Glycosyltransferase, catalytic subunit of cellulose synthase and poly-beta-1,6-N-acetylglucosamine synthase n=1 Tax=Actinocatenispora rupis TaxID=519421 RepID=A0A8J3JIB4_9ACTN|nr:glycosyltransferase family 2 protein [Actinocatenispora rupis]GID15498.1 hypothetical protein Aru02nite_63870 [Actinocatenispora rupis]